MKRVIAIILAISLIFSTNCYSSVKAETTSEELNWTVSRVQLSHKVISFEISNVEKAQQATVVLVDRDTKEVVCEEQFDIEASIQKVVVNIKTGIKVGKYLLYVKNTSNQKTKEVDAENYEHTIDFSIESKVYPNCIIGKLRYIEYLRGIDFTVKIKVGFDEYVAEVDDDGNFQVNYPNQKVGNSILIEVSDEFGCKETSRQDVENVWFTTKSIVAWHNGISLSSYETLDETERICAEVDGITYYSEYGVKANQNGNIVITYPNTKSNEVKIWRESKYGSVSEPKNYTVYDCRLKECDYSIVAYQYKAMGRVLPNGLGQLPKYVKVVLDGKEFSANILQDGRFTISNYPSQRDLKEVEFIFCDDHGCSWKEKRVVYNLLEEQGFDLVSYDVLPSRTILDINEDYKTFLNTNKDDIRLVAQIDGKKYYGAYGKGEVEYPQQMPGKEIKFWLESKNTNTSKTIVKKVYSGEYNEKISSYTDCMDGEIYSENTDYKADISSAYVEINDKKYYAKLSKMKSTEDRGTNYRFTIKYPIQKKNSVLTLYYIDSNKIVRSKKTKLKNIPPKIKINSVNSNSSVIRGRTVAKSIVKITIGMKNYTCKANGKGVFSKKIKRQRKGTKIKIFVTTPQGYTNTRNIKVKQANGLIIIKNDIYKTSSNVKLDVSNVRKGDTIKLIVGSKTYRKKIVSNKNSQIISMKINKTKAGTKVKAILYDKFSKKVDVDETMVYYGNKIYVGMSAEDAELTTWGDPVRRNDYGYGQVQWVYRSGNTLLYVYTQGGKVVNIQSFS